MSKPARDQLESKCGECLLFGAIQGLADGLIMVDTEGRIFHLNRRAEELLGQGNTTRKLGMDMADMLADQPLEKFWLSAREESGPVTGDLRYPDGMMLRATVTHCLSTSGDPIGRALLLRDITNEKKIQVELSDSVARRLMDMTGGLEPTGDLEHLTRREMQILRLLAGGLTNAAIASKLNVSINTVATHMKHLFTKLEVRTRSEAAAFAVSHGMHPPNR
jgi:PAS domain S-box-containing protein